MILLDTPLYPQQARNTCADASARMCIGYYLLKGISTGKSADVPSEEALFSEYGKGSITPIVDGLRDYNGVFFAYRDRGSLRSFRETIEKSLRSGHPVVLDISPGSASLFGYTSDGHYVVAAGLVGSGDSPVLVINDPFHKEGYGIGQTLRLNLNDVYDVVKYMVCEETGRKL